MILCTDAFLVASCSSCRAREADKHDELAGRRDGLRLRGRPSDVVDPGQVQGHHMRLNEKDLKEKLRSPHHLELPISIVDMIKGRCLIIIIRAGFERPPPL